MAKGIAIPKMNRNEGNIISEKPRKSSPILACSNPCGTPESVHKSFTKIIKNMVSARKTSIDITREDEKVDFIIFLF